MNLRQKKMIVQDKRNEGDVNMSDVPEDGNFDASYYDANYFAVVDGKKFKRVDGSEGGWGYSNPSGEWHGCGPIVTAWKDIFNPRNMLDVGCGRGQFVAYARRAGIEAYGFDYSQWAIGNKYVNCDASWITCRDATKLPWIYGDKSFDLVTVLDLMEHLYLEGIDNVVNELYRVSRKWIFLQIATIGGGSGSGIHETGYILKRGEKIPIELEGVTVAGHVTVQCKEFWMNKLMKDGGGNERKGWILRDDMVVEFIKRVDPAVIDNWVKNTIMVLEKV